MVGWSAFTKVQTGSGLPAGPSGLLGGVPQLMCKYQSKFLNIHCFFIVALSSRWVCCPRIQGSCWAASRRCSQALVSCLRTPSACVELLMLSRFCGPVMFQAHRLWRRMGSQSVRAAIPSSANDSSSLFCISSRTML